jgi:hypothetical protein
MVKSTRKELENGEKSLVVTYDNNYRERAFWLWYDKGQISSAKLAFALDEQEDNIPSTTTLENWIREWRERAEELDQEIKNKFSAEVIETKVEMLRRHANLGKELQDIGLEWIRDHKNELTAASVARLIKDGYDMERASVGVPEALTKMLSTSDEELIKQIEAALTGEDLDFLDAN